MIVQTKASILTQLMTADCRDDSREYIDVVADALIMARELALTPHPKESVSNDRTTLKHQKEY